MPDAPPTPPENQQRTLVASLIEQAKAAGLKVRWHNADIVVIGIVNVPALAQAAQDSANTNQ